MGSCVRPCPVRSRPPPPLCGAGGPALFPREPVTRARAREISEIFNSGTQPLQNLAVIRAVKTATVPASAARPAVGQKRPSAKVVRAWCVSVRSLVHTTSLINWRAVSLHSLRMFLRASARAMSHARPAPVGETIDVDGRGFGKHAIENGPQHPVTPLRPVTIPDIGARAAPPAVTSVTPGLRPTP